MSDDTTPTEGDTKSSTDKKSISPSEKKRLARSEVRKALREQRNKLRELRKGMKGNGLMNGNQLSDIILMP